MINIVNGGSEDGREHFQRREDGLEREGEEGVR